MRWDVRGILQVKKTLPWPSFEKVGKWMACSGLLGFILGIGVSEVVIRLGGWPGELVFFRGWIAAAVGVTVGYCLGAWRAWESIISARAKEKALIVLLGVFCIGGLYEAFGHVMPLIRETSTFMNQVRVISKTTPTQITISRHNDTSGERVTNILNANTIGKFVGPLSTAVGYQASHPSITHRGKITFEWEDDVSADVYWYVSRHRPADVVFARGTIEVLIPGFSGRFLGMLRRREEKSSNANMEESREVKVE